MFSTFEAVKYAIGSTEALCALQSKAPAIAFIDLDDSVRLHVGDCYIEVIRYTVFDQPDTYVIHVYKTASTSFEHEESALQYASTGDTITLVTTLSRDVEALFARVMKERYSA